MEVLALVIAGVVHALTMAELPSGFDAKAFVTGVTDSAIMLNRELLARLESPFPETTGEVQDTTVRYVSVYLLLARRYSKTTGPAEAPFKR